MAKFFLENLLSRPIHKIKQDCSLFEAVEKLAIFNIGALPVVDHRDNLKGIISERDLVKAIHSFRNQEFLKQNVKALMTFDLVRCHRFVRSEELMRLMTDKKIRHIPIVNGNTLIGIVSIGDVVKRLLEKYKDEAEHLKQYIYS